MKKFILMLAIIACFASVTVAQSYKLDATGKVVTVPKATESAKVPDKVYATSGTTTFYKGAKGGVYYLKVSKKTGKEYKCYVKQ